MQEPPLQPFQASHNDLSHLQQCLAYIKTSVINASDLQKVIDTMKLALSGIDTSSQTKVFNFLKEIEGKPQTYFYFLFITLSPELGECEQIRYITATTMNSALKRNSQELHFEPQQKGLIKKCLLAAYQSQALSCLLKKAVGILISQVATCFEEIDWQMIHFLTQQIRPSVEKEHSDRIIELLVTIFEDLKHVGFSMNNDNNFSQYFQGAVETEVIKVMVNECHELMIRIVKFVQDSCSASTLTNWAQSFEVSVLLGCIKLIKTVTFNLPLKISAYFETYIAQVLQPLISCLSVYVSKVNNANSANKQPILSLGQSGLMEQVLESTNQIAETRSDYILSDQNFLDSLLTIPIQILPHNSHFLQILKTWTNIILELMFNDSSEEKPRMQGYVVESSLIPKMLNNCRFTKEDEVHLTQEMELEYNPYENDQQDDGADDDMGQFQSKHSKRNASTLRKISITCIEKMCQTYPLKIWNNQKGNIFTLLKSPDAKICEIGVLFLGIVGGALSEQYLQELQPDLRQILEYLLKKVDTGSEILSASCLWSLQKLIPAYEQDQSVKSLCYSKINSIILEQPQETEILTKKRLIVKEAAFSFFDEILSYESSIDPAFFCQMMGMLATGITQLSGRALYNVFKAISTLFESTQEKPEESQTVENVIGQICYKWGNSEGKQSILSPLLECLALICQRRPKTFLKYSPDILQQIYILLEDLQKKNIVLRALDLCSSTTKVCSSKGTTPEKQSQSQAKVKLMFTSEEFLQKLSRLAVSDERQIRHFAYSLISDISKLSILNKAEALGLSELIMSTVDQNNVTSLNNGLMCLTELLTAHPEYTTEAAAAVLKIDVELIRRFEELNVPKLYLLNFSRIFGRLSPINPHDGQIYLLNGHKILRRVSEGLRSQQQNNYTLASYKGVCQLLNAMAPQQMEELIKLQEIEVFIDSFMSYQPNQTTHQNMEIFRVVLRKLKQIVENHGVAWSSYLQNADLFPAVIQKITNLTG